ncbi:MAG: HAD-IA family hydrolase [Candidatus Babeliales bacterium]
MVKKITLFKGALIALAAGLLGLFALYNPCTRAIFTSKHTAHMTASQKLAKKVKPSTVIFDLNGVLFTISKKKAMGQLGFLDIISYTAMGRSLTDLEDTIFDVLDQLRPYFKCYHCAHENDEHDELIPLHKGKPLPHIMRDWMQGEISGEEILAKALPYVDKLDAEKQFCNKQEKRLVKRTIEMLFDPEIRADVSKPIKAGVKLVERCKRLGHKVYLMSNMDIEFVDLLKEKYPEIFDQFDGVIISADVKKLKPYRDIYTHTLKKYKINPATCYLIDDQEENIQGAHRHGITGILCDFHHYKEVRNELRKYGVLPPLKKKKQH